MFNVHTIIDGFTITNGSAGHGGGIYYLNSSGTIANNTITSNLALHGGGVHCNSSSPAIRQNTFQSNTTLQEGGAIFGWDSSPLISCNKFLDNDGGDHGGAIALEDDSEPVIVNNLFIGNYVEGTGGGAINALNAVPCIVNNTFVGNSASAGLWGPGDGGAVILRSTTGVRMYNNIFYDNHAEGHGNSVFADQDCGTQSIEFCDAFNPAPPNTDVSHYAWLNPSTLLFEVIPGLEAGNCLHADPSFADTIDYRLGANSPCTDKGINPGNPSYPNVPTTDMEIKHRPVDIPDVGNDEGNAFCDMGAYEIQQ